MTEKLLDDGIREELKTVFKEQLKNPVRLLFFGSQIGCDYCDATLQLSQEVSELSEIIDLLVHDLDQEPELAGRYKVDKAPTVVVAALNGEEVLDYGIRFAGIPAGHEFASFIEAIVMVSKRESGLEAETAAFLAGLTDPLHLQVFVTPT